AVRSPAPTFYPYTTLFRSQFKRPIAGAGDDRAAGADDDRAHRHLAAQSRHLGLGKGDVHGARGFVGTHGRTLPGWRRPRQAVALDRKSTRLNSSHVKISYA